jgi:hypothetical protein
MSIEALLKTFNERWTLTFLSPFKMAQANFRYTGIGDQVICTDCYKDFFDWQPSDDPLREHVRLSRECPFVMFTVSKYQINLIYL